MMKRYGTSADRPQLSLCAAPCACRLAAGLGCLFLYGCLACILPGSLGSPVVLNWLCWYAVGGGSAASCGAAIGGAAIVFWRFLGGPGEVFAAPLPGRAHAGKSYGAPAQVKAFEIA